MVTEASPAYDLSPSEVNGWVNEGKRGMENALRAKPEDVREQDERIRIRIRIYKTGDLAQADVFDYIEVFHNRSRRYSHLGGVSPQAFERTRA